MKKVIIKLIIFVIALTIIISNMVFANPLTEYKSITPSNDEVKEIGGKVLGIINVVGIVIAISMLLFVGMKFMIASPDERANLKGTLTVYIVGATLLFASTTIASIIYKFSKNI